MVSLPSAAAPPVPSLISTPTTSPASLSSIPKPLLLAGVVLQREGGALHAVVLASRSGEVLPAVLVVAQTRLEAEVLPEGEGEVGGTGKRYAIRRRN